MMICRIIVWDAITYDIIRTKSKDANPRLNFNLFNTDNDSC